MGMMAAAVSVLGTALSLLLSPIGLIVAALVAAEMLIWRYWEPLKAFFTGVFTGIMERLVLLRETFSQFSPIFDAIGSAISQVINRRHVKNDHINRSAKWYYIGAGETQIDLDGVLYPEIKGGDVSLTVLATQA